MSSSKSTTYVLAFLVIFLFVGAIGCGKRLVSTDTITITVMKTERVTTGETSKYLIWADKPDGTEVFKNVDALAWLKYNSSDIQGKLKVDSTYTVTVDGWRVPFLSMYRNVIKIED